MLEVVAELRRKMKSQENFQAVLRLILRYAIALVGDNRKMLIVKLDDIPLMTRGRGVIRQVQVNDEVGEIRHGEVNGIADQQGARWNQRLADPADRRG